MALSFLLTQKSGRLIQFQDYLYSINKKYTNYSYWKCIVKTCHASISINEKNELINSKNTHDHLPERGKIESLRCIEEMKRRSVEEPTVAIPQIYREIISTRPLSDEALRTLPSYQQVKDSLYNARHKIMPQLPKRLEEIHLEGIWNKTSKGDEFLIADEKYGRNRMLIFSTKRNLEMLNKSQVVFMDGTFKIAPRFFKQLYTVHGKYLGKVFPLIYALLTDKSQLTYQKMLFAIKAYCFQNEIEFELKSILLDFETSMLNALKTIFPQADVKGCYFHYTQCIWRKVQALGLVREFRSNEETYKWVRRLSALPMVPIEKLSDAFLYIHEEAPILTQTADFHNYMVDTWLDDEAKFPSDIWNHYENVQERTTNHVEGWHSKMNKRIGVCNPNIYRLVRALQDEQNINEIEMRKLEAGHPPPKKSKRYEDLNIRINNLKFDLARGGITLEHYVDAISYCTHLPK